LKILAYLAVNAAISVYFERKKMRVATVLHAIAFTILLLLEMLANGEWIIQSAMTSIFGESTYQLLHLAMTSSEVAALGPLMAVEMLVPVLIVALTAMAAVKVVGVIRKKIKSQWHKVSDDDRLLFPRAKRLSGGNKMYILKCVMRC
jgi:hypothetical protein